MDGKLDSQTGRRETESFVLEVRRLARASSLDVISQPDLREILAGQI